MRGNVEAIKERLDIVEVVGSYVQLQKAGVNWKGKCPFHNEKTASFHVSPSRQSYYCFGCNAKGDIFTFVEEMEGLDFKDALKQLAEKAGVELTFERGETKTEKDKLFNALEDACAFYEENLKKTPQALEYLHTRGISEVSIKSWRLGFAIEDWRTLFNHLRSLGYETEILVKAGLIKKVEGESKEPYDVFRGRIIFPLNDVSGRVIAFSGRAFDPDAIPKYLNSPDTPLFMKSEVLYGLDKAKDDIRKKNYAVLVEGQMDLVLSHQAGVKNTVASSGTAFTDKHLDRLRRLSPRILLAFDGDSAGGKAAEKSAGLALGLQMEPKVAVLPEGKDPADLVRDDPEKWKRVLRESKHAIEVFLAEIMRIEKDPRKAGKLIEKKILPLVALIRSSIERSHFVSLIARLSGIREEILWEDLKQVKVQEYKPVIEKTEKVEKEVLVPMSVRIEERLAELVLWKKDLPEASSEAEAMKSEEAELSDRLSGIVLEEERQMLRSELAREMGSEETLRRIEEINRILDERKRKVM